MGAHVWKREGGTSTHGVQQQGQQQPAGPHAAAADGPHRPHKKQRVGEPVAAVQSRVEPSSAQHSQTSDADAQGAVAGPSRISQSNGAGTQQQPDQAAAGAHQSGRPAHAGRGGFPGGGAGGRHPAVAGVGSSHAAAVKPAPAGTTAVKEGAAANGAGQQQAGAGRGAGRTHGLGRGGGRGRGRGRGRHPHHHDPAAAEGTAAPIHHLHYQQQQQQQQADAAEEALKKKEREMEALKAKIREKQAKEEALRAAQQVKQQQQQQQQELEQRKSRLNSAFGSAFANAAKARQEQAKQQQQQQQGAATTAVADADEAEVRRVLASKNDYEVLQLKPGCDAAALKKRYKEMAVRLHPDKCKAADASLAFQRAHKAYKVLEGHVL